MDDIERFATSVVPFFRILEDLGRRVWQAFTSAPSMPLVGIAIAIAFFVGKAYLQRWETRRKRRWVESEIARLKDMVSASAQGLGAERWSLHYGYDAPIVTLTFHFPDGSASTTAHGNTYEDAILAAMEHVIQSVNEDRRRRAQAARAQAEEAATQARRGRGHEAGPGRGYGHRADASDKDGPSSGRRTKGSVLDEHTSWWEVLGVRQNAGKAEIKKAYRNLAMRFHPDHGGTAEVMAHLNRARDQALKGF